jgi:uncharacterized protein YjiK
MSTADVKRKLISKIKNSQDEVFLKDIYSLLKDESKADILLLSNEQMAAIKQSEKQIANSQYLTDAEVKKRTSE